MPLAGTVFRDPFVGSANVGLTPSSGRIYDSAAWWMWVERRYFKSGRSRVVQDQVGRRAGLHQAKFVSKRESAAGSAGVIEEGEAGFAVEESPGRWLPCLRSGRG